MLQKFHAGIETFSAVCALVEHHPLMGSLMDVQMGTLTEAFPTDQTFIGPFPGVDSLMDDKVGFGNEGFPTI